MPYKRGDTSAHRGSFWGQNREGCTGLRVSMPWCALCSPKADNTSMVTAVSEPWTWPSVPARTLGPWGGWMKVSHIGSWVERTTPYKHGETSALWDAFWEQNCEGCTGLRVSMPWCELCSPNADNTSMTDSRGLLQWYQSMVLRDPATIGRDLSLAFI